MKRDESGDEQGVKGRGKREGAEFGMGQGNEGGRRGGSGICSYP